MVSKCSESQFQVLGPFSAPLIRARNNPAAPQLEPLVQLTTDPQHESSETSVRGPS